MFMALIRGGAAPPSWKVGTRCWFNPGGDQGKPVGQPGRLAWVRVPSSAPSPSLPPSPISVKPFSSLFVHALPRGHRKAIKIAQMSQGVLSSLRLLNSHSVLGFTIGSERHRLSLEQVFQPLLCTSVYSFTPEKRVFFFSLQ